MATAPKPNDDFASLVSAALSVQKNPQSQSHPQPPAVTTTTHPDPDYPAESFRLPPEAELEWLDRSVAVAAIYERDDSTKGTANPKAQHGQHQNQNQQQQHGSNRFSGPLKPRKSAILGLPKSIQRHSGYLGAPRKGKGTATRIFPKKKGKAAGKEAASGGVEEPGSPKVSCFGKVKSERERCREEMRRMRREAKELEREEEEEEHEVEAGRGGGGGFWSCLLCRGNPAVGSAEEDSSDKRTPSSSSSSSSQNKKNKNKKKKNNKHQQHNEKKIIKGHRTSSSHASFVTDRSDDASSPHDTSSTIDPPGLGGLKRFASGRRSSSWGGGEFEASGEQQESGRGGGVHGDASSGPVAPARRSVG